MSFGIKGTIGLNDKEAALISAALLMTSKMAFDRWQETNDITDRLMAEDFRSVMIKFNEMCGMVDILLDGVEEVADVEATDEIKEQLNKDFKFFKGEDEL